MAMERDRSLATIGWRERVDLPEWGFRGVKAKIDTGARTSAIDVAAVEEQPDGLLRFEVVSRLRPTRRTRWVTAEPARTSVVKPSHGAAQERHVCVTRIRIGEHELDIELSLVCRAGMLCRMLIGRTALADRFVVDPARTYLLTTPPGVAAAGDDQAGEART
ncbi:MAG: RimK/LysX family protein [Planctomycetota bacterium]